MTAGSQGSLKSRIIRAGGWNVLQVVVSNMMRLGSNLVMTRLLVPEAFGLMSFIMTIVTAFTMLSDIGINRSIIRDADGDTERFLRAAWVVQIWRSLFIGGGVLVSAILAFFFAEGLARTGTVYADPLLPFLIAAISILPVLDGLKSTNWFIAERRLQNGRIIAIELLAQVIAILSQIAIAMMWPSVWTLVIGTVLGQLFRTILSHAVFQGPGMKWEPNAEIAFRIWSFGKYLMGSSVLTFAAQNTDKFILASLLGSANFGLYAIAQIWASAGRVLLGRITDKIGFAVIGEVLRTRPTEAPALFKRFQRSIDVLCVSMFVIVLLLGEPFIRLMYTEAYQTAGHYLKILSLGFLALRFDAMIMFVLNSGNSRALMVTSGLRAAAITTLLPLGYYLIGMEGALMTAALAPLASAPYTIWLVRPLLGQHYALRQFIWLAAILFAALGTYLVY